MRRDTHTHTRLGAECDDNDTAHANEEEDESEHLPNALHIDDVRYASQLYTDTHMLF